MLKICAQDSLWLAGQALWHIAPLAAQEEWGALCITLCRDCAAAVTQLPPHPRPPSISTTQPKLFSKAQFFNICWFSSQKEKGSVPYFSKINATVKSWQKIRATILSPKRWLGWIRAEQTSTSKATIQLQLWQRQNTDGSFWNTLHIFKFNTDLCSKTACHCNSPF